MALVLAASLLSANFGLAIWLGIAFLLLMFLLGKFAWGPITSALDEREQTIEASITRAEAALAEAKQLQSDNEAARREAEGQAQRILADARDEAARQREAAKADLAAELTEQRERASADIERQKQQALGELRAEVAALAVGAAEKILRKEIDAEQQRGLVDQFIADLPQN
ncbi:F0F1 ATP synthase subunit B [Rubrivirga marina]|uniref:ATP synthase subunit b n=1 Tax=Rubrivirga marina TaxID=1196024 RepID=A0A271J5K7_9BACT|nr:F0F1 ATP synthase subunit B [Rubrivirga marina]PAP78354.1 ATP synthase F0 subunit B [Rubrivirga marina]